MLLSLKYLYATRSNVTFKRIAREYLSVSTRCVKLQNCKSASGISSKTTNSDFEVPEGTMESCDMRNGMRLVCECKESFTTTVGCFLPAGAMYEMPKERGSALFLEHLLFTRTTQRSREQLDEELQSIGAKIDVVAMRDMFLFYGTVASCDIDKLIELFGDVIMNGFVCGEDIDKQKCIILHELSRMELDKERVAMDYLPTIAYQDTELAKSIYPETDIIKKFCVESLTSFRNRVFKTCYMTMVSTGSTSLQELQESVCIHFDGEAEEYQRLPGRCKIKCDSELPEFRFSGAELRLRDDDEELGYIAIGFEGPGCQERRDHVAFTVAKQIVGSWDKSYSGANHNAPYLAHCAFNSDMCHMYKSFFHDWAQTTSIWGCYFVCDKLKLEDMHFMVRKEWMRLCTTITQKEVSRAANQCKMNALMTLNDPVRRFLDIAHSLFRYGYYTSVQERLLEYQNITANDIREVTGKYIYDQSPAVVALGRVENFPDYSVVRSGMYLLRF